MTHVDPFLWSADIPFCAVDCRRWTRGFPAGRLQPLDSPPPAVRTISETLANALVTAEQDGG